MATVYTTTFGVWKEIQFYNAVLTGEDLNLSYFSQIAQNRWTWIVQNWNQLNTRFTDLVNGDQLLTSNLQLLKRDVDATNLGAKNNPLNSFTKVIQYDDFLSAISTSELKLDPAELSYFNKEIERVLNLDVESFRNAVKFLKKEQAILADTVGLGDADASALLGLTPSAKKREPTIADLEEMDELQNLIYLIQGIIFNIQTTASRPPNQIALSNDKLTPESEASFVDSYQSYVLKPFDISLENMAQKYLGSTDRWFELVTVNGLQPPYIDEKGSKISLLSNGALNSVIISSDKKDQLFVGQKIRIGSFRIREESRVIDSVTINENGTMVLFLSGNRDLNKLLTKEEAFIRSFAPATTRNGEFVSIPLVQSGFTPSAGKTPSSDVLQRLSLVFRNFGIDIAHDQTTGDIIIDSNGNFRKSYGLEAVRQTVMNAVKTEKGELPFHPDYGVNLSIGERFYGTSDETMLFGQLLRETILRDSRFSNALISGISSTGNSVAVQITVYLDGTNEPVSLSFVG